MAFQKVGTPEYIKFLLSPDTPLDFHVQVGNPEQIIPEKIGAVRWMLIARSKVLRVMLLESQLKESSGFKIKDLDPQTFKHFLTYMYGHDTTKALPFEDSIKLLNAAEKYDVEDLKDSLGKQIKRQVSSENVCTVLKYPEVCEQVAPLWENTTRIIQNQTAAVFADRQFVNLSLEAMLFILQQDSLSVQEIDIWQASLRWAKHKSQLQDEMAGPEMLRELVLPLLNHIRVCTLSIEQLTNQVVPTNILTPEETSHIITAINKNLKSEILLIICNSIQQRGFGTTLKTFQRARIISGRVGKHYIYTNRSHFQCQVKDRSLQLCSVMCVGNTKPRVARHWFEEHSGNAYDCRGEVKITCLTDSVNTSAQHSVTVSFNEQVLYSPARFEIPMPRDGGRVVLHSNNKYAVEINFFMDPHRAFSFAQKKGSGDNYFNDNIDFKILECRENCCMDDKGTHMMLFTYVKL